MEVAWFLSMIGVDFSSKEDELDFEGDGKSLYDFSVSGMDKNGSEVTLDLKAFNARHAHYQFRQRGFYVTSLKLKDNKPA